MTIKDSDHSDCIHHQIWMTTNDSYWQVMAVDNSEHPNLFIFKSIWKVITVSEWGSVNGKVHLSDFAHGNKGKIPPNLPPITTIYS